MLNLSVRSLAWLKRGEWRQKKEKLGFTFLPMIMMIQRVVLKVATGGFLKNCN